jgi:hypothetical protein
MRPAIVTPFTAPLQATHFELASAPIDERYLPALQALQTLAPAASWYLPAEQGVHAVAEPAEYAPAGQPEQAPAPSRENFPLAQLPHAAVFTEPVSVASVPAGHFVQLTLPVVTAYFPEAHDVHSELLDPVASMYFPTAQLVQADAPVADIVVPGGQLRQALRPCFVAPPGQ